MGLTALALLAACGGDGRLETGALATSSGPPPAATAKIIPATPMPSAAPLPPSTPLEAARPVDVVAPGQVVAGDTDGDGRPDAVADSPLAFPSNDTP